MNDTHDRTAAEGARLRRQIVAAAVPPVLGLVVWVLFSGGSVGEPCTLNSDCRSFVTDLCAGTSARYCTTYCRSDADCQAGWTCWLADHRPSSWRGSEPPRICRRPDDRPPLPRPRGPRRRAP